jgi:peptidoglycan hydrolase-like protein with peptidoglycan-binding domain
MAKSQIRYGSQGADVKELQKALNQNGYKLTEDGIFGANTLKAVKDYQQKNKLSVDGIVGDQTWNAVLGLGGTTNQTNTTAKTDTGFKYDDFSYADYTESDAVKNAEASLNAQLAQKPGEYQSQWQAQLNDTINKILNREKFSYDLNGDALYQQYKDKYIQQGKMAMGDAIGQASAMTGGYGNSYAQSVGQQAYQAQLQNLNDIVPELYQMAYDKYNQEGQDLYNQYSMLGNQENQDYGRYRDTVNDWQTERNYLADRYDNERSFDYSKYTDDRNFTYGKYGDDKKYAYQSYADKIAQEQWQAEFDEAKRQFDEQMAFSREQYNDSKVSSSSTGAKSSSPNVTNKGSLNSKANYVLGVEDNGSGDYQPVETPSGITDSIRTKASGFSNNTDLANYLDGLAESGVITEAEADALFAENKQVEQASLDKRSWTLADNGGVNWFWGIDNNATVKDQYGNTYRLDNLVDALVSEGMSKSDAKTYVKKLQDRLNA